MFVAATTRSYAELEFFTACQVLTDLEFDKIEIWMDENSNHLKPSVIAANTEQFLTQFRECTRLSPIAIRLAADIELNQFRAISRLAKQLRITQIVVPASQLGTPFNAEIDRLKSFIEIASQDGVRVSIPTQIGCLTQDPRTAVELCQSTKGLGLTLDPSHFIVGPHRGVSLDPVYPHVFHVHLRDTSKDELQVLVGLGELDYSRLVSHLSRTKYQRSLTVDINPEGLTPEQRPVEMRKLRRLLETLL